MRDHLADAVAANEAEIVKKEAELDQLYAEQTQLRRYQYAAKTEES